MRSLGFGGLYPGMVGLSRGRRGGGGVAWTVDATSGIATPANATEWAAFIAAKGLNVAVPDVLHLFDEVSGPITDVLNGHNLTFTGTPTYQVTVTGWARPGVAFPYGGSVYATNTDTGLPDISTTSMFTLAVLEVASAPASAQTLLIQGTTADRAVITNGPRVRAQSNSNTADGTTSPVGVVRPYGLLTNRTTGSCSVHTDVDSVSVTFSTAVTGKKMGVGSGSMPAATLLYQAVWFGLNAEAVGTAVTSLYTAMGF